MAPSTVTIQPMLEADLPAVVQITNEAFRLMLRHLLGHEASGRLEGVRVSRRFFHPAAKGLVIRDQQGVVQGAAFVQILGSRSIGGPIAISSRLRAPNAALELVQACVRVSAESGCRVMDSVTFSNSPQHMLFHWRRGADPLFPAIVMQRSVQAPPGPKSWDPSSVQVTRYSALSEPERDKARGSMRRVTETIEAGFDVSAESQYVLAQKIGETYLAALDGRIVGFAVTQRGPNSEAFRDEEVQVKLLFVDGSIPFEAASSAFHALLDTLEEDARGGGFQIVTVMASGGRRASVSALLDRGMEPIVIFTEYPVVHAAPKWHQGRADIGFTQPTQFALVELR